MKPDVEQDPSKALQEITPHGRIRKLQARIHADAVHTAGGGAVPDCIIENDCSPRCDEESNRESENEQRAYALEDALLPEAPLEVVC
jgi:hypothetical protein